MIARSAAEALLATVTVPVCVIGPNVVTSSFVDTRGGRVLLALSLHRRRISYLQFSDELARGRNARLVVFHVLNASGTGDTQRKDLQAGAREALGQMIFEAGLNTSNIEIVLREGSPARAILAEDVCPAQDFFVMGSSSLSLVSQMLDAGIVHEVIAGARCPVMTLRVPGCAEQICEADAAVHDSALSEAGGNKAAWSIKGSL